MSFIINVHFYFRCNYEKDFEKIIDYFERFQYSSKMQLTIRCLNLLVRKTA